MANQTQPALKVAIVVDQELPLGLCVNTAAVLALSLGRAIDGIVGPDLKDGSGTLHAGITTVPIPILATTPEGLRELRDRALTGASDGVHVVDFSDAAQRTRTYEDYAELLSAAAEPDLRYLGIAVYGPKKAVQRLTGNLSLLR